MIRHLSISLIAFLLIYCSGTHKVTMKSNGSNHRESPDLFGEITLVDLYDAFPDWKSVEENYDTDTSNIKSLSELSGNFHVEIFLGTWCSDSRREVPRFFKIWYLSGLGDHIPMKIYAVDRDKKLENGLAQERKINFVPTFIFYKENIEIGRIIETPDDLLEKDVLTIMKTNDQT